MSLGSKHIVKLLEDFFLSLPGLGFLIRLRCLSVRDEGAGHQHGNERQRPSHMVSCTEGRNVRFVKGGPLIVDVMFLRYRESLWRGRLLKYLGLNLHLRRRRFAIAAWLQNF